MKESKNGRRAIVVAGVLAVAILIFLAVPPITQDQSYHAFADARTILGIPNFWNVVSNLPFAFIGILGLRKLRGPTARILCAGVLLTSFGSAYYHLAPTDPRLVWDRLPMTLVFMSFLSWIVAELNGRRSDARLLLLFVLCGIVSVMWWQVTGDLRPYVFVQFGPIAVLLPALWKGTGRKQLWVVLALYALAKMAEYFDHSIYSSFPISGHACKHLLAALACYWIIRWRLDLDIRANSTPMISRGDLLSTWIPV